MRQVGRHVKVTIRRQLGVIYDDGASQHPHVVFAADMRVANLNRTGMQPQQPGDRLTPVVEHSVFDSVAADKRLP